MLEATNGTDTVYYTRGFELISRHEGDAASFYLYDGGLSVRALTDEAGAVTDTLVFDAFGNETEKTGTTANTYGFQGEEKDATGLYYLSDDTARQKSGVRHHQCGGMRALPHLRQPSAARETDGVPRGREGHHESRRRTERRHRHRGE